MNEELERAARMFAYGQEQRAGSSCEFTTNEMKDAFMSGAMWAFGYLHNSIKIMCENNKFDNHGKV